MAIDLQPESTKRELNLPSSFNVLFYYSIVLLLVVLSSYALFWQWNSAVEEELENRQDSIEVLSEQASYLEHQEILSAHREKLNDFNEIYWNRNTARHIPDLVRELLHPAGYVHEVNADFEEAMIRFTGNILSYDTLEQQQSRLRDFEMKRDFRGWVREDNVLTKEVEKERDEGLLYEFEIGYEGEEIPEMDVYVQSGESAEEFLFSVSDPDEEFHSFDWRVLNPFEELLEELEGDEEEIEHDFSPYDYELPLIIEVEGDLGSHRRIERYEFEIENGALEFLEATHTPPVLEFEHFNWVFYSSDNEEIETIEGRELEDPTQVNYEFPDDYRGERVSVEVEGVTEIEMEEGEVIDEEGRKVAISFNLPREGERYNPRKEKSFPDSTVIIRGNPSLFRSPFNPEEVVEANVQEKQEAALLERLEPGEYDLQAGAGDLEEEFGLNTVWYEVEVHSLIEPIESVELTEINQVEEDFPINFGFTLEVNPIIFNY